MTAHRTAFTLAVPTLAALALTALAGATQSEAASDRPLRQFSAAVHDMFAPPRRVRRAKPKQTETTPPRAETPDATTARRNATQPAPEKAIALARNASVAAWQARASADPRPGRAVAKAQRVANLPAAQAAPAAQEAPPPQAQRDVLPAKPRGRLPQTAALPPAAAEPEPRPGDVKPADKAEPKPDQQGEPAPPSACQLRLTEDLAAVKLLPPIKTEQCAVEDVVRLDSVTAKDGRRVAMSPPATLRCPMAEAVVHWVRDELAAAASDFGAALKAVSIDTSYECRGRNRVKGAKLSEHGHANAIDVRTITLTNGTTVGLTDITVAKAARERLKAGACAHFTTVLGPGSDGYHENHVHLDRIERRGGYRMCQWDVRDIADVRPMPRERPPEAPPRTASTGKTGARN